jgi:hypothetical protein
MSDPMKPKTYWALKNIDTGKVVCEDRDGILLLYMSLEKAMNECEITNKCFPVVRIKPVKVTLKVDDTDGRQKGNN